MKNERCYFVEITLNTNAFSTYAYTALGRFRRFYIRVRVPYTCFYLDPRNNFHNVVRSDFQKSNEEHNKLLLCIFKGHCCRLVKTFVLQSLSQFTRNFVFIRAKTLFEFIRLGWTVQNQEGKTRDKLKLWLKYTTVTATENEKISRITV